MQTETLNIIENKLKQHMNKTRNTTSEIMKQFLQSFPPGSNRFDGIPLHQSPNGQPILPEGLAWLEGTVQQRMECGDHWLIYADVQHGKVLDEEALSAVHHRRIGDKY